ncbi:hypothetical protein ACO0LF_31110, partial [Undibacterium sp. Di27W]|uniref:hypothetical protein n=1 Tax=Undibacterium sp. Di27W TaxID=3413036 RepID=UPI003BF28D91
SSFYDNADLLKESTDANGNKTTYAYDDVNRLISKTLIIAGSDPLVTTYVYDAKGQQVEITDPNKVKTKLEYDLKGQLTRQTVDPDGLKLITEFDYDKRGKTLTVTQKGATQDLVQRYVFDKLGRRIEEYTGNTLTRSYQYDANNNVISSTDADGNTTRFAYDSEDRQVLVLDAAGGMQRTIYDENGHVKSVRRYATPVNLTGLGTQPARTTLEALVPAETAQDRFSTNYYDKDGRVTSTVDALGGTVSYVYDANNNVIKKTSGDGINTANDRTQWFAYDGLNRLAVSIAADGSVIANTYDSNGNITSTTAYANRIGTSSLAVGATPQTYLSQVQVNAQQDRTERHAYDAANRLVYNVDAQGYVTKNTYEGSHLKSTTQYDKAISISDSSLSSIQANLSTSLQDRIVAYSYDHAGHLLSTTDALGHTESYTYNELGQKTSFTNKKGATWTYTYDAVGRLATETAPAVEVVTTTLKNAASAINKQVIALVTRFVYDSAGNLIARVEADNTEQHRETRYGYDALGRQTDVTYPPVDVTDNSTGVTILGKLLTTHVSYDALGNAVSNIDVAGKRSYKVYDQLGRVRFDIDANGYLTEYKRNTFGEVETLIRYANDKRDTSNPGAPTLAQIIPVVSAQDRQIKTSYNTLGQAATVTESIFYGSDGSHFENQAKVTNNTYNAFGELSSVAVGRNVYDASGSLLQTGVDQAVTRYAYNQRGQQVAILDAENYLTRQQFDAAGNLVLHTEFAKTYADLASNWANNLAALPAAEIADNAGTSDRSVRYEYDQNNRKISETRLNVEFAKLSSIARADNNTHGAVKTSYGYDALGNLLSTEEREVDNTRANSPVNNIGLTLRSSYSSYDMLGRVMSTTSSGSGVDNKAIYTTYQRDAYGNAVVTKQTEMKQGNTPGNPLMAYMGSMGAGENLMEGQALYSANGRFQLVLQPDGNLVVYDRQQGSAANPYVVWSTNTRAPSGSTGLAMQTDGNLVLYHAGLPLWQSATQGSGMVLSLRDDSNLVMTNASQQIVWQTSTFVAPDQAITRTTMAQYNAFGKVTDSVDAESKRSAQSYDANGNLVAQQRKVTDVKGDVVGNSGSKAMVSMEYNASGKLVRTVELGVDGSSDTTETRYEYNAFGELQRQTVNGQTTLLNEYDNEGHLWRTTSGGLTKVLLVDQEGRNTVQITSGDTDLRTLASAEVVASHIQTGTSYTSSMTRYDHLGHVIEKQLPNVGSSDKLEVAAQGSLVSFTIKGNPILDTDIETRDDKVVENDKKTAKRWNGDNSIEIKMLDMASWGYGDVKISVRFTTKNADGTIPATISSFDKIYGASTLGNVVTFKWPNEESTDLVAQDNITDIIVSKKDSQGQWVVINKLINNASNGGIQTNSGNQVIKMTAPIDLNTVPEFRYRLSGDNTWSKGKVINFGANYVFNPMDGKVTNSSLPGTNTALAEGIYDYQIDYKQNGVVVSHSDGKMTVGYGTERMKAAQLYVSLFDRAPTAGELDETTGDLTKGSLDQVAQKLLDNPELKKLSTFDLLIDRIYVASFNQTVDAPGKAYWLSQWNNGSPLAHGSVVADIIRAASSYLGSDPGRTSAAQYFSNRVSVALTYGYDMRGNDIAKAIKMLSLVTATDTKAALAVATVGIVTEAQNRMQLTRLYVLLQNRSPEKGGIDYYIDALVKKSYTLAEQAGVILDQSAALKGKSNTDIASILVRDVLSWTGKSGEDAQKALIVDLNAASTSTQKADKILQFIDKVVNNSSTDFDARQAQQLFNNRVNVGLLYGNYFEGNNPTLAATINAQVTATDTLTAINTVFGQLNAAQNKELNLARLYVLLFNRAPDPKGFAYWLQQGNLNSNITFSAIANAVWTDKFSTVSNLELVKQIYGNTLGGDPAQITDSNAWVLELNMAGQPGGSANKGEVLERMINQLVNPADPDRFSSYARQVFTLKVATGINFVKLGGSEGSDAALALSAVEKDLKSMSASLALKQVQTTSTSTNLAKLEAQANYAATQLAAAGVALEA